MRTHHAIFKLFFIIIILSVFSSYIVLAKATLTKVGKFNTGMSYGLSIKNNFAYITTNTSLFILDVKNPEKPVKAGELIVGTPVFGLCVRDNFAFLAASDKGLVIADISDPENPYVIGIYSGGGTMYNVEGVDNYCYTINYEIGFEVIDISNPAEPRKISGFPASPRGLSIQDDFAFVSDLKNGLTILNIADPENIKRVGVVENTGGAAGIKINNELLYLGSYNNWIKIYRISEPQSPQFVRQYTKPYEVSGFAVTDNFLVTKYRGIIIEEITDLKNPLPFAKYSARGLKGKSHEIVVQNEYVYYVLKGLTVLKIEKD